MKPKSPTARRIAVLTATVLITVVFLGMVQRFLGVLFLAALIAATARPLQRRSVDVLGGRNGWAAGLTLIGLVLPALAVLGCLGMVVFEQGQDLKLVADKWLAALKNPQEGPQKIQELLSTIPLVRDWNISSASIQDFLSEHAGAVATNVTAMMETLMKWLMGMIGGMGWWLLKGFVMLYATYFFLREGPRIRSAVQQTIPLPADLKQRLVEKGISVVRATLKGTLVIGLLQGLLAGVGFWVAGVQGSAFWGLMVVFSSVVPGVGTGLIWGPIVCYLAISGKGMTAFFLFLWCALAVGLADNILRPRLVGNDTRMPDLLILVSTLGGVIMFGPIGILLGPALAAVCVLMWDVFQQTFGETYQSDDQTDHTSTEESDLVDAPG